jgi:DNA polymerase-1
MIACDTEGTGLDVWHGCKPFMIQIATNQACYYWTGKVNPTNRSVVWDNDTLDEIIKFFEEADEIWFFNAKFDIHMMESIGIEWKWWNKTNDVQVAHHCIYSNERGGLKPLSRKYVNYPEDDEEKLIESVRTARDYAPPDYLLAKIGIPTMPIGQNKNMYKADYWLCPQETALYGCGDAERTYMMGDQEKKALKIRNKVPQYKIRMEVLKVLYSMEKHGMYFDIKKAKLYCDTLLDTMDEIEDEIKKITGCAYKVDLRKERFLSLLFFDILKLPVLTTTPTGLPAFNSDAINTLIETYPDNKVIQLYAEWVKADTEYNYTNQYILWCTNSRLHSNFWLTGTRETRQASEKPNTQNIPKAVRKFFVPPPGKLYLDFDLVNIELRIWAYCVKDKNLIKLFEEGKSVHLIIAEIVFPKLFRELGPEKFKETEEYGRVKNGNFSLVYGATRWKADATYGVPGAYDAVIGMFPGIEAYIIETNNEAKENYIKTGEQFITTLGGYKLHVPLDEPHKCCNYKIQGTAGYLIGLAMIEVSKNPLYLRHDCQIVNQVHDSLIIEYSSDLSEEEETNLTNSLIASIEDAGKQLIPTCKVSYKYVCNPEDVPF